MWPCTWQWSGSSPMRMVMCHSAGTLTGSIFPLHLFLLVSNSPVLVRWFILLCGGLLTMTHTIPHCLANPRSSFSRNGLLSRVSHWQWWTS
ncbi:hypothetical protein V8F06_014475 [Rhypophila decipiens]